MLHAKALAVTVAYDVYLECAEGTLSNEWRADKPCDFYTFREKLANQMLKCSPQDRRCPGDEKFRVATQQAKSKRKHASSKRIARSAGSTSVSVNTAVASSTNLTRESFGKNNKRLCGDLPLLYRLQRKLKRKKRRKKL